MVQFTVLDEYDNGWKAVRGSDRAYVVAPSGDKIDFGSSSIAPNSRRARLFAALCVRVGRLPLLEELEVVPVEIAVAGKSELAAYLWSVHYDEFDYESRFSEVADLIGIDPDSLSTYFRRVIRSASDRKIGGTAR